MGQTPGLSEVRFGIERIAHMSFGINQVNTIIRLNRYEQLFTTPKDILRIENKMVKATYPYPTCAAVYSEYYDALIIASPVASEFSVFFPGMTMRRPVLEGVKLGQMGVYHMAFDESTSTIITFGQGVKTWKLVCLPLKARKTSFDCEGVMILPNSSFCEEYSTTMLSVPAISKQDKIIYLTTNYGLYPYSFDGELQQQPVKFAGRSLSLFAINDFDGKMISSDRDEAKEDRLSKYRPPEFTEGICYWTREGTMRARIPFTNSSLFSAFFIDKEFMVCLDAALFVHIVDLRLVKFYPMVKLTSRPTRIFFENFNGRALLYVVVNAHVEVYEVYTPWKLWLRTTATPLTLTRHPRRGSAARILMELGDGTFQFLTPVVGHRLTTCHSMSVQTAQGFLVDRGIPDRHERDQLFILFGDGAVELFAADQDPCSPAMSLNIKAASLCVAEMMDRDVIVFGTKDGDVIMYSYKTLELFRRMRVAQSAIRLLHAYQSTDTLLALVNEQFFLISLAKATVVKHANQPYSEKCLCFRDLFIAGYEHGGLIVRRVAHHAADVIHESRMALHKDTITGVSHGRDFFVTCSADGVVVVWNMNAEPFTVLRFPTALVSCCVQNGRRGILLGISNGVMLVDGKTVFDEVDEEDIEWDNYDRRRDELASNCDLFTVGGAEEHDPTSMLDDRSVTEKRSDDGNFVEPQRVREPRGFPSSRRQRLSEILRQTREKQAQVEQSMQNNSKNDPDAAAKAQEDLRKDQILREMMNIGQGSKQDTASKTKEGDADEYEYEDVEEDGYEYVSQAEDEENLSASEQSEKDDYSDCDDVGGSAVRKKKGRHSKAHKKAKASKRGKRIPRKSGGANDGSYEYETDTDEDDEAEADQDNSASSEAASDSDGESRAKAKSKAKRKKSPSRDGRASDYEGDGSGDSDLSKNNKRRFDSTERDTGSGNSNSTAEDDRCSEDRRVDGADSKDVNRSNTISKDESKHGTVSKDKNRQRAGSKESAVEESEKKNGKSGSTYSKKEKREPMAKKNNDFDEKPYRQVAVKTRGAPPQLGSEVDAEYVTVMTQRGKGGQKLRNRCTGRNGGVDNASDASSWQAESDDERGQKRDRKRRTRNSVVNIPRRVSDDSDDEEGRMDNTRAARTSRSRRRNTIMPQGGEKLSNIVRHGLNQALKLSSAAEACAFSVMQSDGRSKKGGMGGKRSVKISLENVPRCGREPSPPRSIPGCPGPGDPPDPFTYKYCNTEFPMKPPPTPSREYLRVTKKMRTTPAVPPGPQLPDFDLQLLAIPPPLVFDRQVLPVVVPGLDMNEYAKLPCFRKIPHEAPVESSDVHFCITRQCMSARSPKERGSVRRSTEVQQLLQDAPKLVEEPPFDSRPKEPVRPPQLAFEAIYGAKEQVDRAKSVRRKSDRPRDRERRNASVRLPRAKAPTIIINPGNTKQVFRNLAAVFHKVKSK